MSENDYRALHGRQLMDRALDVKLQIVTMIREDRIGLLEHQFVMHSDLMFQTGFQFRDSVERDICDDPVEPCAESRFAPKRLHRLIYSHEGFLRDILCLFVVVHDTVSDVVCLPHVVIDERAKRCDVSFFCLKDKLPLIIGGHQRDPFMCDAED